MSIPLALSPVGYDTWVTELRRALITYLGSFDLVVDYLPNEKELVVHTDQITEDLYNGIPAIVDAYIPEGVVLEQYNHSIDIPWQDWTVGYTQLSFLENSSATHISISLHVSNNTRIEVTGTPLTINWVDCFCGQYDDNIQHIIAYNYSTDHRFRYIYGGIANDTVPTPTPVLGRKYNIIADGRHFYIDGVLVSTTAEQAAFETRAYNLFSRGYGANRWLDSGTMRIYDFNVSTDAILEADYVPAVDPSGEPCMYDKVMRTAKYMANKSYAVAGIETLAQLQNMARNLPSSGNALTVSMPETFQTDAAAQSAIAAIEAKGWVLTKNYRTDETT